jgi:putative addiction module component (TIGR02574 family)
MVVLNSVLEHARELSPQDQAKLIDTLWDAVPADADIPLHSDWAADLERRVTELKAGAGTTIPWTQIRAEALARMGHGSIPFKFPIYARWPCHLYSFQNHG